jgi:hypothetical protein
MKAGEDKDEETKEERVRSGLIEITSLALILSTTALRLFLA